MTTFQKAIIGILSLVAICIMVNLTVVAVWIIIATPTSKQTVIVEATPASEPSQTVKPGLISAPTAGSNEVVPDTPDGSSNPLPESTTTEVTSEQIPETVTKTSGSIIDAVVAGGGKYIILRMQSLPGLAVYDADEKKIIHAFNLASENFLYTAGGNVLLVYYPENNLLQTWSLDSFEKLLTKPNAKGTILTYLTMGHSNAKRALIRYALGTEALDRAGIYLLDVDSLQEIPTSDEANIATGHNSSYRDFIHQRTDGSMQIVSEWATSHTPSGLGIYLLKDNSWTSVYDHDSVGYITVGDDGLIYTQVGSIYNSQLTKIGELRGTKLIPGIGGTLFLGISDSGSMQVYASSSTAPIGPVGDFPSLGQNSENMSGNWANTPYVFDRHIVFDPKHGHIILIPPENDRIIQRDFDLNQLLEKSGVDYLVVTSVPSTTVSAGENWRYKIETISNAEGIKFTLEFGPKGMEISNDGTLSWNVPANHSGAEKVVILIENEKNEAIYHNFELQVK